MADETPGDKTEAATPRRREEARDSGRSPQSRDLTRAALLMAGLLALSMSGHAMVESMSRIMLELLGNHYWGRPEDLLKVTIRSSAPQMLRILSPVLLTAVVVAFVVTVVQVGLRANWAALMPRFEKLNPVGGFGRLFAGQNWMQLAMNLLKLVVLGAIAWSDVQAQLPRMLSLVGMLFPENFSVATEIIYDLAWRMAMALLIIAAADWIYHRWQFERDIRMSKQEIKDESKNMTATRRSRGDADRWLER